MPNNVPLTQVGFVKQAPFTVSTAATHTIVAASAGKQIRVFKLMLYANGTNNITINNLVDDSGGTGADTSPTINFLTNSGMFMEITDPKGGCSLKFTESAAFSITLSAAQAVTGIAWYTIE